MGPDRALLVRARTCLDDPDSRVASKALAATELLARAEVTRDLVDALHSDADTDHRWTQLDGLIAISDPGDAGRPRPWWSEVIGPALTRPMREYALRELKRARGKTQQEADRKSR